MGSLLPDCFTSKSEVRTNFPLDFFRRKDCLAITVASASLATALQSKPERDPSISVFATAVSQATGNAPANGNFPIRCRLGLGQLPREILLRTYTLHVHRSGQSLQSARIPGLFRSSQHDAVSWICGYRELRYWYSEWKVGEAILDSAHDALPIYSIRNMMIFPPSST